MNDPISEHAVAARQAALELAEAETAVGLPDQSGAGLNIGEERDGTRRITVLTRDELEWSRNRIRSRKRRHRTLVGIVGVSAVVIAVGLVVTLIAMAAANVQVAETAGAATVGAAAVGAFPALHLFMFRKAPHWWNTAFKLDSRSVLRGLTGNSPDTSIFYYPGTKHAVAKNDPVRPAVEAAVLLRELADTGVPGAQIASDAWDRALIGAINLKQTVNAEREAVELADALNETGFATEARRVIATLEGCLERFHARADEQLAAAERLLKQQQFNQAASVSVTNAVLNEAVTVELMSQTSVDTLRAMTEALETVGELPVRPTSSELSLPG